MEAASRAILTLFFGLTLVSCAAKKSRVQNAGLNGQFCVEQVIPKSFLVQWKEEVPKAFEENRLFTGSLITRFSDISKAELENSVLSPYENSFSWAEHEFETEKINLPEIHTQAVTAWGPKNIRLQDAWNHLGVFGDDVIVAVIDSGVDSTHPLLAPQMWTNPGESGGGKETNGVDDDGNGLVDDVHGWNFGEFNSDISDSYQVAHGTHVAGVIAGQAGDDDFTGVAPNAKIMGLKFIDDFGTGPIGAAISSINYAQVHGAKVINASWGGRACSTLLKEEIVKVTQAGVVFVAAAGNSGLDLNAVPEWPAAFIVPGKLTVGSIGENGFLSFFSNYGRLVDLAAPGDEILSTVPSGPGEAPGKLFAMRGTSMAAPFVSGVAALMLSYNPSLGPVDVANLIKQSVVIQGHLDVSTSGKLDAYRAARSIKP